MWSYPPDAVVGPTLFDIPAEELFFFVVQTYTTSLIYTLLTKATLFATHLRKENRRESRSQWMYKLLGMLALGALTAAGAIMVKSGGEGMYMGLILVWASPFMLFLWYDTTELEQSKNKLTASRTLSYQLLLGMSRTSILLPILLPTAYLWVVDTIALRRGTWVIETGTKFGVHLWPGLEIE